MRRVRYAGRIPGGESPPAGNMQRCKLCQKNYLCMDTNITTMKVLLINGSPHREGNTFIALSEVARTLEAQGIGTEIVHIGTRAMQGCIACGKCAELGHCVFSDAVYTAVREKLAEADGLVVGSPVYYAGPNGSLCALLDRVFYSCGRDLAYKPAAICCSARRAGTTTTLDQLVKYPQFFHMPLVNGSYWAMVHGSNAEQVLQDAEGCAVMQELGRNMAWLLHCIEAGRAAGFEHPQNPKRPMTNFIR